MKILQTLLCVMLVALCIADDNELSIEDFGMFPEPSQEMLDGKILSDDILSAEEIKCEDINGDFSNIDDLIWLKPIIANNKALLLGEEHYFSAISKLRNRILFAINTWDYYPLIIFESQYSISPFINHYCTFEKKEDAEKYLNEVIYDMVLTEEQLELMEHIRKWNLSHPEKKIYIGYTDIEHDWQTTISKILVPYFKKINPDMYVDTDYMTIMDLPGLIEGLRKRCTEGKEQNIIGDYDFITPDYISNVLDNLESTYNAYFFQFDYYRQRAIIRNTTDPKFFGKYAKDDKILIHGGGYHTTTNLVYPDGGNFYREGCYLQHDFEPTKGKTFSIMVQGYAKRLGKMAQVGEDEIIHPGTGYKNELSSLKKVYDKNLIGKDDYVLFSEPSEWSKLIYSFAKSNDCNALKIDNINWEKLYSDVQNKNMDEYRSMKYVEYFINLYDLNIIILQSDLQRSRLKVQ